MNYTHVTVNIDARHLASNFDMLATSNHRFITAGIEDITIRIDAKTPDDFITLGRAFIAAGVRWETDNIAAEVAS